MKNIAKKASVRKRKKNEKSEKKKSGRNEKTVLRKKVCILKCDLVVQFCEKRGLIYDIFIHISGKRLETEEERRLRKEKEKRKDGKDGKRSETEEERRIRKEKERKDRDKSEKEG